MTASEEIAALMRDASPETKDAVARIFTIEKEHAYRVNPVGVKEQVLQAIREAVK